MIDVGRSQLEFVVEYVVLCVSTAFEFSDDITFTRLLGGIRRGIGGIGGCA